MREDREIGRWLAYRIGLLFPVIPRWGLGLLCSPFAGQARSHSAGGAAWFVGAGLPREEAGQATGAVATIDGRLITSAYQAANPGWRSRQPNSG